MEIDGARRKGDCCASCRASFSTKVDEDERRGERSEICRRASDDRRQELVHRQLVQEGVVASTGTTGQRRSDQRRIRRDRRALAWCWSRQKTFGFTLGARKQGGGRAEIHEPAAWDRDSCGVLLPSIFRHPTVPHPAHPSSFHAAHRACRRHKRKPGEVHYCKAVA
nr:hypothetical protein CFP56_12184 [Quercus suber]